MKQPLEIVDRIGAQCGESRGQHGSRLVVVRFSRGPARVRESCYGRSDRQGDSGNGG